MGEDEEVAEQPEEDLYPEVHLCISCLTENLPHYKFCRDCGAPIDGLAAIMPFERIWAEGWIFRTAATRPNWMALVYFGLSAAAAVAGLVMAWGNVFGLLAVMFYYAVIWCALFGRAVKNYTPNDKAYDAEDEP